MRKYLLMILPIACLAATNWDRINSDVDFWMPDEKNRGRLMEFLKLYDQGRWDEGIKLILTNCGKNSECVKDFRLVESRQHTVDIVRAKVRAFQGAEAEHAKNPLVHLKPSRTAPHNWCVYITHPDGGSTPRGTISDYKAIKAKDRGEADHQARAFAKGRTYDLEATDCPAK